MRRRMRKLSFFTHKSGGVGEVAGVSWAGSRFVCVCIYKDLPILYCMFMICTLKFDILEFISSIGVKKIKAPLFFQNVTLPPPYGC